MQMIIPDKQLSITPPNAAAGKTIFLWTNEDNTTVNGELAADGLGGGPR